MNFYRQHGACDSHNNKHTRFSLKPQEKHSQTFENFSSDQSTHQSTRNRHYSKTPWTTGNLYFK